jgi:hypothetical protein
MQRSSSTFEQFFPGCQIPNTKPQSSNERRAHLRPRPLKQHAASSGFVIVDVVAVETVVVVIVVVVTVDVLSMGSHSRLKQSPSKVNVPPALQHSVKFETVMQDPFARQHAPGKPEHPCPG